MSWLIVIICLNLIAPLALGFYWELRPMADGSRATRRWKVVLGSNVLVFVGISIVAFLLEAHDVLAQQTTASHREISIGLGLALLGAGIPTALAAIGAGLAVGPIGAASLAVIAEKPEMFGRTLIYLGLAEGIAIYGLVVTILLLGKIA